MCTAFLNLSWPSSMSSFFFYGYQFRKVDDISGFDLPYSSFFLFFLLWLSVSIVLVKSIGKHLVLIIQFEAERCTFLFVCFFLSCFPREVKKKCIIHHHHDFSALILFLCHSQSPSGDLQKARTCALSNKRR